MGAHICCLLLQQRGERDSQTQAILTKLKCAAGLAELAARKYKQAAKCFLLASFDHCDFPEVRRGRHCSGCPSP